MVTKSSACQINETRGKGFWNVSGGLLLLLLTPSKKPGNAKLFYTILDQLIIACSTTPQNSEAFIDGFTSGQELLISKLTCYS